MDGFLTAALLACTVAPVFAFPVTNSTGSIALFEPEPRGHGTIGILSGYIITFGLCTWTSTRPNILPPGSSRGAQLKYKLLWVVLAAIFPQVMTLCAFAQWRRASRLHKLWLKQFPVTHTHQEDVMGMEGAFFVLMGGFILPKDGDFSPILTANGFEKYLSEWRISRECFSDCHIHVNGKASYGAKLFTFIQAGWLILPRLVAGLPVTLLEIHVANQAVYTLFSYFFWWSKPLDVGHIRIELLTVEGLGLLGAGVGVGESTLLESPQTIMGASDGIQEATETEPPQIMVASDGAREAAETKSTRMVIGALDGAQEPIVWAEDEIQEVEPPQTVTEQVFDENKSTPSVETFTYSKGCVSINEYPRSGFFHLLLRDIYDLAESIIDIEDRKMLILIGISFNLYGGLHLFAWENHFSSHAENVLWKISCLIIGFISAFSTALIPILNFGEGKVHFLAGLWETRFYNHNVWTHIKNRAKAETRNMSWGFWGLAYLTLILFIVYLLLVMYITLGALINLRSLPKSYYHTPVWANYWPHFD